MKVGNGFMKGGGGIIRQQFLESAEGTARIIKVFRLGRGLISNRIFNENEGPPIPAVGSGVIGLSRFGGNQGEAFPVGIASGSDMVMIGHLILTEIDAAQPAPFSYRIVTELLREELGFQGVVITDGLQMKALTDSYTSGEIARRAVSAGVDILLCPSNPQAAVSALEEAVALGEISEERINQSVRRILAMKVNRGVLKLEG